MDWKYTFKLVNSCLQNLEKKEKQKEEMQAEIFREQDPECKIWLKQI